MEGPVAEARREDERNEEKEAAAPSPKSVAPKDGDADGGQAVDTAQQPTASQTRTSVGVDEPEVAAPDTVGITPMEVDKPEQPAEPSPSQPVSTPSEREPLPVDADGDVEVTAPPPIQEPPRPVFTLSTGQSIGVQIDPAKAADLAPDTTVVDVTESDHVNKVRWRPNDPVTLAAGGEAFCGLWKVSGPRSSLATPTHPDLAEGVAAVTAFDWDATGEWFAVATYKDFAGVVTIYDSKGTIVNRFSEVPRLVSILRWASRGTGVLLVMSDGERSNFRLCDAVQPRPELPPSKEIEGPIYDVSWSNDGTIFACGDGSVYQAEAESSVQISGQFTSEDPQERWTLVRSASRTGLSPVAVVASTSTAKIWIPGHDITVPSAHHSDITSIEFRPQSPSARQLEKDSHLTLATSSMDDTVKLWSINLDAKEAHCTHRLYLGESSPALAAAFSPDGYAIAAASQRKLFIWHAERGGTPLATWEDPTDDNVKDEVNGEGSPKSEEVDHLALDRTLSWDTDGKKLALGFGQKVCDTFSCQPSSFYCLVSPTMWYFQR